MLQHSRIRATYNIEGRTIDDCCSSYYCSCCTLMQDDREIVARERRETEEKRKYPGLVNDQPRTRPHMQYAAPHRGSLEIRDTKTPLIQNQDFKTRELDSEKQNSSGHSNHIDGHKKLQKVPDIQITNDSFDIKGKM